MMPFWFWNDVLDEGELKRQVRAFQRGGFGGVVIHPRMGLSRAVGYLTARYFALVLAVVAECAALGLKVILYDEGSYPSGSACGAVVAENPEYAARAGAGGVRSVASGLPARRGWYAPRGWRAGTVADQDDVRRIALSLPEASEGEGQFGFGVSNKGKRKGFVWVWMERVTPKQPRVPNPEVLAVRVPNLDVKEMLLQSDGDTFFTEPHYNGFPAVLVRLPKVGVDELTYLITEAWRCQAPRALVEAYERGREV